MANFTLRRADVFPNGTVVNAYKQSNWPQNIDASGAPQGASDGSATSDGTSLTFTGLARDTDYYAVAQVSGVWRYIAFRTSAAASVAKGVAPVDVVGRARRTLLNQASGAQTASGNSAALDASGVTAVEVDVNITAVSGTTPSATFVVERQGADGVWYVVATSPAITAAGTWTTSIGPGCSVAHELTDSIRLRWTITGTTPSFTFSASITGR